MLFIIYSEGRLLPYFQLTLPDGRVLFPLPFVIWNIRVFLRLAGYLDPQDCLISLRGMAHHTYSNSAVLGLLCLDHETPPLQETTRNRSPMQNTQGSLFQLKRGSKSHLAQQVGRAANSSKGTGFLKGKTSSRGFQDLALHDWTKGKGMKCTLT